MLLRVYGSRVVQCWSGHGIRLSGMPQTTASAYLADWAQQDWAAMRPLTDDPPADFTSVNQAAFTDQAAA